MSEQINENEHELKRVVVHSVFMQVFSMHIDKNRELFLQTVSTSEKSVMQTREINLGDFVEIILPSYACIYGQVVKRKRQGIVLQFWSIKNEFTKENKELFRQRMYACIDKYKILKTRGELQHD